MNETLELGGQHEKDHQKPEHEHEQQRPPGIAQVQGLALVIDHQRIGQMLARQLLDVVQRGAQGHAILQRGFYGDSAVAVVAIEGGRSGILFYGDQVRKRYQLPGGIGSDVDIVQ